MSDGSWTLGQVLNFVNSLHQQCRDLIRDSIRLLRDEHRLCLAHTNTWDYAVKPNDRFLEQHCSMIQRCWSTFVPADGVGRGAVFDIEFYRPNQLVPPRLLYGAVTSGPLGFGATDRWASYNTTHYAEQAPSNLHISHKGPITILAGKTSSYFPEAHFVRVPLESIVDQCALRRVVVAPLAALLNGKLEEASTLLQGVVTESWPGTPINSPVEDLNDPELP